MKKILIVLISGFMSINCFGWTNHSLLNYYVMTAKSGLDFDPEQQVRVETLGSFIQAQQWQLVKLLDAEEKWAQSNVPGYKPLPSGLRFDPTHPECKQDLVLCFKHAIRINPDLPLEPIIFDPFQQYTDSRAQTLTFAEFQQLKSIARAALCIIIPISVYLMRLKLALALSL